MSKVFLISDLHLSHTNMAIYRGFKTVEEHDEHIIERWNSVVTKKDVVWILGDITMEKVGPYHLLDRLKGIKKVVLGNHDMPNHVPKLLNHVNAVCSTFKSKGVIFTHIPIHSPVMNRFRKNIHGHLHENKVMRIVQSDFEMRGEEEIEDDRYLNVSCECVDFTPVLLNDLI